MTTNTEQQSASAPSLLQAWFAAHEGQQAKLTTMTEDAVIIDLDEAGFTARQVADQLAHAYPSMTLDVYFGRHVVSAATADVLNH